MQQLNRIEAGEIKRLDSKQLVCLLHCLLWAEAKARNIDQNGIHVPFEINVADGGTDGEWRGHIEPTNYIPASVTAYQVKAQELGPTECKEELHFTGKTELKPRVAKVLNEGGAFVFFCSHPYVAQKIEERLAKAREALLEAGRESWATDRLVFLDGGQIADWVNQHSSALAYISRCVRTGQQIAMRDFRHWSGDSVFSRHKFQSNAALDRYISEIRSTLSKPKGIVRITGPSGLGKSRLAYETFNAQANGSGEQIREALASSVVYLDVQINGRAVLEWVNQLTLWGLSGAVVVDNCSREYHNILERAIQHPDSRLSLLSLDYVSEVPIGRITLPISLVPEEMRDVVPKILASIPDLKEKFGDAGVQRISDFAQGFPQIAILTAEAGRALGLETLNQQGRIADRLLWGYDEPDSQAKELIRCLAAFTEVGFDGKYKNQLEFVRQRLCNGISDYDFRRITKRFRNNRVLQEVGDFLMVAPPPLAVALAADWLEDLTEEHLLGLLTGINEVNLVESFASRLRQLDFSERAQSLSDKLMGPTGPFSSAEVLNSEAGSRVFRSLSELNPVAATQCIQRVFSPYAPAEMKEVLAGRRELVWALERLCWKKENFVAAARILRSFAAGENETWSNNATGQFRQLFHVLLSGTQCPPMERLDVIREGLVSEHSEVRTLSVSVLGEALRSDQFMRTSGPEEQGTKPPERDWHPRTYMDIWDYWRQAFFLLESVILNSSDVELASQATEVLGQNLRGIVLCPLADELLPKFRNIAERLGKCWPAARDEIKSALDFENGDRHTIEGWLECVNPQDLRSRLIDKVAEPGWHHQKMADGSYSDVSEECAILLAEELLNSDEAWMEELDVLLVGNQQQTFSFGRRCGELMPTPIEFFGRCLNLFRTLDPEKRNPQMLRGLISTIRPREEVTRILADIAAEPGIRAELLVPLTVSAHPLLSDFKRIADLVESGAMPPESIRSFSFGGVTREFPAQQFAEVLRNVKDHVPGSAATVLEVAFMYRYGSPGRLTELQGLLEELVVMPEVLTTLADPQTAHHWRTVTEVLLREPTQGLVANLTRAIVEHVEARQILSVLDTGVSRILGNLLRDHSDDAWPVVSERMRDESGKPKFAIVELLCRRGYLDDSGTPLWELPAEKFRKWAEANEDILPYLLAHMPLFFSEKKATILNGEGNDSGTSSETNASPESVTGVRDDERYVWHPLVRIMLDLCGSARIKNALDANIFSFGSTGSRVPYLQKRVDLMKDLAQTENIPLKNIALSIVDELEAEIARERKLDLQHAAGIHLW